MFSKNWWKSALGLDEIKVINNRIKVEDIGVNTSDVLQFSFKFNEGDKDIAVGYIHYKLDPTVVSISAWNNDDEFEGIKNFLKEKNISFTSESQTNEFLIPIQYFSGLPPAPVNEIKVYKKTWVADQCSEEDTRAIKIGDLLKADNDLFEVKQIIWNTNTNTNIEAINIRTERITNKKSIDPAREAVYVIAPFLNPNWVSFFWSPSLKKLNHIYEVKIVNRDDWFTIIKNNLGDEGDWFKNQMAELNGNCSSIADMYKIYEASPFNLSEDQIQELIEYYEDSVDWNNYEQWGGDDEEDDLIPEIKIWKGNKLKNVASRPGEIAIELPNKSNISGYLSGDILKFDFGSPEFLYKDLYQYLKTLAIPFATEENSFFYSIQINKKFIDNTRYDYEDDLSEVKILSYRININLYSGNNYEYFRADPPFGALTIGYRETDNEFNFYVIVGDVNNRYELQCIEGRDTMSLFIELLSTKKVPFREEQYTEEAGEIYRYIFVPKEYVKVNEVKEINESLSTKGVDKDEIIKFIGYCVKRLKIKTKFKVILTKNKNKTQTLAHFDPNNNEIVVYITGRHNLDIERSICHELFHLRQKELGLLKFNSGDTGSEIENVANAGAGIVMRDYNKKNPNLK